MPEAYHLQSILVATLGEIGGWKVGAPGPAAEPLCSPLPLWGGFAKNGDSIGESYSRMRGVEAEIAFRLGRDLPVRSRPYSREEVVAALASTHPAIELLESAFDDPDKVDRLSMIGDLQLNGGFIYGKAVAEWQQIDLAREKAAIIVDGVVRAEGTASNPAGPDLLRLVVWLANEGQFRTGGLNAGDWITTGSWTGKVLAKEHSEILARFSSFGELWVRYL